MFIPRFNSETTPDEILAMLGPVQEMYERVVSELNRSDFDLSGMKQHIEIYHDYGGGSTLLGVLNTDGSYSWKHPYLDNAKNARRSES